jgi:hypothetical protein
MEFPFDNFNKFSIQHASPSCRKPVPTNYLQKFYLFAFGALDSTFY